MSGRSKLNKSGIGVIALDILIFIDAILNIHAGNGTGLDYVALIATGSLLLLTLAYCCYKVHKKRISGSPQSENCDHVDDCE